MAESSPVPGVPDGCVIDAADFPTTRDTFLGGRVELLQPARGYRAGIDAVLLAASVPVSSDQKPKVLDCGAGIGAVGLCLAARVPSAHVVLVEREPDFVHLAKRNVELNRFKNRVEVVQCDLLARCAEQSAFGYSQNSFSHVVANPPFFNTGQGTQSPYALKAAGHQMTAGELDGWLRFMARMTEPDGLMVMIQPVFALPELLRALDGRFGAVAIVPIYSRAGSPAKRMIVSAKKGTRAGLTILPGFVLHEADNSYTPAAQSAFKYGSALEFF